MTAMNRFFVYKKCAKLWIPMVCISIVIIAILELTNLRPFGDSENATGINRLLVTLSYSIIGANLFIVLMTIYLLCRENMLLRY